MRTITPFLLLIATAALLALGCDRAETQSTAIGRSANGLVGDEASDDSEIAADAGSAAAEAIEAAPAEIAPVADSAGTEDVDEFTPDPLAVIWTDGANTTATTTLTFDVTNVSAEEISFSVAVVATSVIGDAKSALGEATLAPGEVASYSLSATELPVRSDKVVSQLFAALTRSVATPDGSRDVTILSAGRFYRHDASLGQVRAYDERSLHDELGGVTSQLSMGGAKTLGALANTSLGQVADGDGGFASVSADESGAILRNEDGQIVGCRLETSRSAVPGAAAASPEMEVSDE
jgi:hypothetical protein